MFAWGSVSVSSAAEVSVDAQPSSDGSGVGTPAVGRDAVTTRFEDHCFDCHGYGESEGGFSFEQLAEGRYGDQTLAKWEAVWHNLRSETMPPADYDRPDPQVRTDLLRWIQNDVFRLDASDIDPGKVVLRRLNRNEYRRTVRDLTDVDLDVRELLPADNTGYGFDTIGEVLTLSPVVLERYIEAASEVVRKAIPADGPSHAEHRLDGWNWYRNRPFGDKLQKALPFEKDQRLWQSVRVPEQGRYRFVLRWTLDNGWVETEQAADVTVSMMHPDASEPLKDDASLRKASDDEIDQWALSGKRILETEAKFEGGSAGVRTIELDLQPGTHWFFIDMRPTNRDTKAKREGEDDARYGFYPNETKLVGPLRDDALEYTSKQRKILFNGPPSPTETKGDLRKRAREVLQRFATHAYRRPVDDRTLDRLTDVVMSVVAQKGRYEVGVAEAVKLVLVSPRFLYRIEVARDEPLDRSDVGNCAVPVDDYTLASRLSYLLWGTMPDITLMEIAGKGELHDRLDEQIDRMIDQHWRLRDGIEDFVGQWLQVRNVDQAEPDPRAVLRTRDRREAYRVFNYKVQRAMKEETYEMFKYLVTNDRPVHELLNADYTFLNEPLAEFYGIDGVDGSDMRKVELPKDSHRRGILTHGSVLLLTSNPTRTSPVKRGLFVLENLLGSPSPPAPPDVPELEDSAKGDLENASLRAILERHRSDPACASCHSRMDPLGLALENFNALGQFRKEAFPPSEKWWQDKDAKKVPVDAAGTLMTGESFSSVSELADVLANQRRDDFYRCLTEKWLTFALGRGMTYRDVTTIDRIVDELKAGDGRTRTLIKAMVRSVPMTHMRRSDDETMNDPKANLAMSSLQQDAE